jgi:hypothetical protein
MFFERTAPFTPKSGLRCFLLTSAHRRPRLVRNLSVGFGGNGMPHHGSNAPWGETLAPHDYGEFSHMILVANHGSGQIAAFDPFTGRFAGFMLDPNQNVIRIDGLWALDFADGGIADFTTVMGPYNACYFTAGTQMEQHGLFGSLVPVDSDQTHDEE